MAGHAAPEQVGHWVDAAPFRAQLHHLMGSTALSATEVAAAAGISSRLAVHLAYGRNGRALRRVHPETGRRLMALSVTQLRRWRSRQLATARTDEDGHAA